MDLCSKNSFIGWIVFFLLSVSVFTVSAVEESPKYCSKASPLILDSGYFRRSAAVDFWRLMPFYVGQHNEYACSVASVAMVFNAGIKSRDRVPETERNITQDMVVKGIHDARLRDLVSTQGFRGRHGLTLDELAGLIRQTASSLGVEVRVTAHSFAGLSLENFREILKRNERNPRNFLLVHFVQDDLTGARGGPYAHISPIGAYDGTAHRTLILDVDREWYSPYWVRDADLLSACNHVTNIWGAGGLIDIEFDSTGGSKR